MLNGIREVLNSNQEVDYLYFLSGQDYPIKSTTFIEDYLSKNRQKSFVCYSEIPNKYLGNKDGGMYRFTRYHYQGFENRTMNQIINRCLRYLNFALPKRKFPKYLKKPYSGVTWMGFSTDIAKYIMSFIDVHPDYLTFHQYSYCSDEIFFQTILLNSNDDKIRLGIVNKTLTYTDWGKPGPRPAILTINDFDALSKADQLFARKFDISIDSKVLDIIDEKILSRV